MIDVPRWLYGDPFPVEGVSDFRIFIGQPVCYVGGAIWPYQNKESFLGVCLRGGPPGVPLRIGTAGVYSFDCPDVPLLLGHAMCYLPEHDQMWPTGNSLVAIGRAMKRLGIRALHVKIYSSIMGGL